MTINNFKRYIRKVILDRGKEYFKDGKLNNIAVLSNMTINSLFKLFRDDSVTDNNKKHLVKFEEQNIRFEINRVKDDLFTLSADKKYNLM